MCSEYYLDIDVMNLERFGVPMAQDMQGTFQKQQILVKPSQQQWEMLRILSEN